LVRVPLLSRNPIAYFIASRQVSPGDLICDIETDKATIGWEAQEEGYIAAILVPEGSQDVPVGKAVLVVAERYAGLIEI
jgi:pyruvate/2-oxoglutarate dehydrogenase complex dihydrolipoamide acyltransferase (E2) component